MSWFDGSFSFARTALSQAQKSIDKVLDIREDEGAALDPAETGVCLSSCVKYFHIAWFWVLFHAF